MLRFRNSEIITSRTIQARDFETGYNPNLGAGNIEDQWQRIPSSLHARGFIGGCTKASVTTGRVSGGQNYSIRSHTPLRIPSICAEGAPLRDWPDYLDELIGHWG